MSEKKGYNGWMPFVLGISGALVGLFFFLAYLDIVPVDPADLNGPRWALAAAGVLFGSSGLLLLSQMFSAWSGQSKLTQWVQYALALSLLTSFAAIFLWIGFGAGERDFDTNISFSFGNRFPNVDVVIGRMMFGGFGLFVAWLDIYFAVTGFKKIMKNEPFEE